MPVRARFSWKKLGEAIRIASRAATGRAPHSAHARVRRRVRVVRSTSNVAVAQATTRGRAQKGSFSRGSSVTHGQKHGAACHRCPAGDEPGPERARGRARVLRVASGGEGEVQAVLPRGTHAPTRPKSGRARDRRKRPEPDPRVALSGPVRGKLFRSDVLPAFAIFHATRPSARRVHPTETTKSSLSSLFLLSPSPRAKNTCSDADASKAVYRLIAHASLTSNPEPRRALAPLFFFFRRRRCAARCLGSCARTGWRR